MKPVLELIRKSQWRWDFITASHGSAFHAPIEAQRVLSDGSSIVCDVIYTTKWATPLKIAHIKVIRLRRQSTKEAEDGAEETGPRSPVSRSEFNLPK